MSIISKYGLLQPLTKPVVRRYKEKVRPEMELPDITLNVDAVHITTVNTSPAYRNKVIHNLNDYRRTDQTLLLLPEIRVAIDYLLESAEEGIWDE